MSSLDTGSDCGDSYENFESSDSGYESREQSSSTELYSDDSYSGEKSHFLAGRSYDSTSELYESSNFKEKDTSETELYERKASDKAVVVVKKSIENDDKKQQEKCMETDKVQDAEKQEDSKEHTENKQEADSTNDNKLEDEKVQVKKILCRNEELEGEEHPETHVIFEKKVVDVKNKRYEVVVPRFDSAYDAQLPENKYEASDREQFSECNSQLKQDVSENPEMQKKFDKEQITQINNGDTPDGYTWHHDAEVGKMQLVNTHIHMKTGHTGGRSIWGGGSEKR